MRWPRSDGSLVSCTEKLRTLEENHVEARQVLQDAFEDGVLMGVDEAHMRRTLTDLVEVLHSPKRP